MYRTPIRIADEEYQKVLEYAKRKELSFNDGVRWIIREWQPIN